MPHSTYTVMLTWMGRSNIWGAIIREGVYLLAYGLAMSTWRRWRNKGVGCKGLAYRRAAIWKSKRERESITCLLCFDSFELYGILSFVGWFQIIVAKVKGEPLGVVIVESGWGSMVPTVVLANMSPSGPAARCSQLNIGDQIISINGISLVGLPLSTCQSYIKVSTIK